MANNLEIVKSLRKMLEMLPKELTEEEKKKSVYLKLWQHHLLLMIMHYI